MQKEVYDVTQRALPTFLKMVQSHILLASNNHQLDPLWLEVVIINKTNGTR